MPVRAVRVTYVGTETFGIHMRWFPFCSELALQDPQCSGRVQCTSVAASVLLTHCPSPSSVPTRHRGIRQGRWTDTYSLYWLHWPQPNPAGSFYPFYTSNQTAYLWISFVYCSSPSKIPSQTLPLDGASKTVGCSSSNIHFIYWWLFLPWFYYYGEERETTQPRQTRGVCAHFHLTRGPGPFGPFGRGVREKPGKPSWRRWCLNPILKLK